MSGKALLLASLIFLVSESISINLLATLTFNICVHLDEFRCLILDVVVNVWEAIPTVLVQMMAKYILQGIIRHLHYRKRYFLPVVETLELTGPVNRNMVTRPVNIGGVDVPPLLHDTERLCAPG